MKIKMLKRFIAVAMSVIFVSAMCACGDINETDAEFSVVTTSFPLYDIVRSITKDGAVDVVNILPWGSDGHDFDPSVGDVNNVARCDLFIYCGDELEAFAEELFDSAGGDSEKIDVSSGLKLLTPDHGGAEESHGHGADPHIWVSPENMLKMTDTVYKALERLGAADPEKYSAYKERIASLDKRAEELAEMQRANGKTLFFGDAFAFLYLTSEYGFEYMSAYPGCSDEVEPSITAISDVSNKMIEEGAGVIFIAERSEGKAAKTIAEETGAEVLVMHSCHNITKAELDAGATYFSMMSENLDNVEKALISEE